MRVGKPVVLGLTAVLLAGLACNIPLPTPTAAPPTGIAPATEAPLATATLAPTPAAEPDVVVLQDGQVQVVSLDGTPVATWPIGEAEWPRSNTAQVVGDAVYYLKKSTSAPLVGVVARVSAGGEQELAFTQHDSLTGFAVSSDGTKVAWAFLSPLPAGGYQCELWTAAIDGSNANLVAACDPNDTIEDYYTLEPVTWLEDGSLVYAWQITGIGGYILYFGFSSLYRHDPVSSVSTALIEVPANGGAPCWNTLSPDAIYAAGGCGSGPAGAALVERELASGLETILPALPEQGQVGGASYSPSGARLAYGVARGNMDDEAGQVAVRLARGDAPQSLASVTGGYFGRTMWVDEARLLAQRFQGSTKQVVLLQLDGTLVPLADGMLVGLMWP